MSNANEDRKTAEQHLLPLIEAIYRAAVDRDAWADVAEGISQLFGGAAVFLNLQTPGLNLPSSQFYAGTEPLARPIGLRHAREGVPWLASVGDQLGKRFIRMSDHYPPNLTAGSEFDRDFLSPRGLEPEPPILHVTSPEETILSSLIVVYRRRNSEPVSDAVLGVADRLVPHLGRAIDILGRLQSTEDKQVALHEVIDRIPTGVVVLDAKRRPLIRNRMAMRIAASEDGFMFSDDGPRARDRETTLALHALIDSATMPERGRELAAGGFMSLPRSSGLRAYPVLVTPVLGRTHDRSTADAAAVIFISDPEYRDLSLTTVLTTVYGLTPAEAELAQLLAQGHTLEEAAGIRSVTLNTARSQLKQVFAKTETNRQGELLQLILSGVATIDEAAPPAASVAQARGSK